MAALPAALRLPLAFPSPSLPVTALPLLLQLLCCCPRASGAPSPRLQPPPLLVTCPGPHGPVSQRKDSERWASCLWSSTVTLRYQPAPGARPEAERKGGQPPAPPHCRWALNSLWVKNTSRWSGQVTLHPSLPPRSGPVPVASSLLTVQCSSASCAAPECSHRSVSIELTGQDVRLFVLWPQTHLIHTWQPVELGWCARLRSASWQYRFSSPGGSPSTLLLPSTEDQDTLPPAAYPTAELQHTCAAYYSYRLKVRYRRHGLHVASVSIEQMPHVSLNLSLKVEPDLLHVLSIGSQLLSVPQQPLSLSWSLQPLTPRTLAYRLVDTQAVGGWLRSYSSFTRHSNFCAVPAAQSPGEVPVASIYFHADGKRLQERAGELRLLNGTLSLRAGRETLAHVNLHPGNTNRSTYVLRYNHGVFSATEENNSPTSAYGPATRTVFYQHEELSYFLSIEFVAFQWYKFNMYLYIDQKRALVRSLADRDLEVHVFKASARRFLQSFAYLVWFIPAQHPMLQCEWTFHLQVFGTQRDHLLQNITYAYNDRVRNAARLVRRSALPFDPEKYTGFVAKVNCSGRALTPALLRVRVNNHAAKNIEAPVSCQQQACYIDTVQIQKPVLHTSVLHQKRGTSFYLFVRLLVDCNVGISIKPLWRIYPVRDTTTIPDWSNPINSSSMYGVRMIHLTVPSFTLDYGLYLFYFTVEITPIRTTTVLRGSDHVYIQIDSTDLVANIAGGTFRTVGFSDGWTLDGSASYDPDSPEGLKGITFTWYCTKEASDYKTMQLSPGKGCHPAQRDLKWSASSGPVQAMPPESLPGNAVYYFRLGIQKDRRRSYADQTVDVQPGSPLLLGVACLENCGSTLIPTERFTLSGKCRNCGTYSQPAYYWTLLSENSTEISFDWSSRTSTGRSGAYVSIHALTFTKTAHRSYVLLLQVSTWDGRSSAYRYAFTVNSPPRAGKCAVSPPRGTAFLTRFVVQCSGFSDSNSPLTYKVIVASNVPQTTKITSVEENTFGTILYFGYQPRTPPTFLPAGVPAQKYALTLYVQVRNSLGAFTQVSLYVRVENPVRSRPLAAVFHELLASVSGLSAPMTSYLQTGDYFSAGYLAYLAASVFNHVKAAPSLQLPKAQFRESLIKTALNISVESTMEVNQVVAALSQVTEEAEEVNVRSQDLAIKKLSEVTGVLKTQRDESHWSEEAEIQTSGILRCLSNLLRAALLRRRAVNVNAVKRAFSIMENLTEIVFQGKVPGERETLMETKHWNITLKKDETWNLAQAFSARHACRNCFYPSLEKGNHSGLRPDAVISTALFEFEENPFPWLGYTSEIATTVLGFRMAETKANGHLLGMVPQGAEATVARKDKEPSTFPLAMGPDKTQAYTTGGFRFEVSRNTKSVYIQILTKLKVTFKVLVFTGANITHAHPTASFAASHNTSTVASENETASADCNIKAPYTICLPASLLAAAAQRSGTDAQNVSVVLLTPYVVRYQTQRLVSINIFSAQCLFLDGVQSVWREDTCRLGSLTDWQRVHCVCNTKRSGRRMSGRTASTNAPTFDIRFLAAKVIVAPNTVDLGEALIAEIPKNPVTLLTVLFVFALYFLVSLWAIRKDRADRDSRDEIIVLPDNDPLHEVSFLVTLHTGSRWGAGTKADVFLQLIGQNGTSDVHHLRHPRFPSLQRGSTDCFLLTTKKDLGDICSLRVWHNNKGPSPGWFLSRAKVENMSTRKTWFFLCRKWLSLARGDRLIERTFPVTHPKAPLPRMDYFLIKLSSSLTEGHVWGSLFAPVPPGTFSRLQGLSACLAMLLFDFLVNIMFFNADKEEEASIHLRYLRSVTVGIECALLTIPAEMIINALFKYSQKEPPPGGVAQTDPKTSSPLLSGNLKNWKERVQKLYLSETSAQPRNSRPSQDPPGPSNSQSPARCAETRSEGAPRDGSKRAVPERDANVIAAGEQTTVAHSPPGAEACQRRPPPDPHLSVYGVEEGGNLQTARDPPSTTSTSLRKRLRLVFRRWRVYFSWAVLIAVTGLSAFFIVLYGLSYGYQTSLEWLLASAISFLKKVFVIPLLKTSFFSAVSTISSAKDCENIAWLTHKKRSEVKLDRDTLSAEQRRELHLKLRKLRGTKQYKPLDADEIANMLKREEKKAKAFICIKDFVTHVVFLTLLLRLAYSTENANTFHYSRFIHNQFSRGLFSVEKLEHIYTWVTEAFLPLIHNDIQPAFLPGSWSKIIGLPRMRQVRAKGAERKCSHAHSFGNNSVISGSRCLHTYGRDVPEKGDYAGSWTKVANRSVSKDAGSYDGFTYQRNRTPWVYYSYGDLHTYGPAGYTFYFFLEEGRLNSTTRLDALQQHNWLDEKTWAVIVELTVFNADADLFCTISVLFEKSDLGIIKPSLSVHSFALPIFRQQTKGQALVFALVLAFLFIHAADELYVVGQERRDYVKSISNVINLGLKSAFLLFVVLKVTKFKMGADIVNFYLLHPNDFIHFHAVSHLDRILRLTMGFLAFLVILKTLKYSQFCYNVRLAQRSILAALPGISSMALMVVVVFSAFMAFGYLVFGQHERNYNTMTHSAQTVVSYCVPAFRDTTFSSNRLLGTLFLASFMLVMICVLINLFRAVIISAHADRKQPLYDEPSDEAQAVTVVLQSLRKTFYRLTCKTSQTSEPELLHGALYGQPERRHRQHLGLRNRKIGGREMAYLVI